VCHIGSSNLSVRCQWTGKYQRWLAYFEATVSPRNDGKLVGTCARSSDGGRTGRCLKCVEERSIICFWSWENDTKLETMVSEQLRKYKKIDREEPMGKSRQRLYCETGDAKDSVWSYMIVCKVCNGPPQSLPWMIGWMLLVSFTPDTGRNVPSSYPASTATGYREALFHR
jgi:hypothetical protein